MTSCNSIGAQFVPASSFISTQHCNSAPKLIEKRRDSNIVFLVPAFGLLAQVHVYLIPGCQRRHCQPQQPLRDRWAIRLRSSHNLLSCACIPMIEEATAFPWFSRSRKRRSVLYVSDPGRTVTFRFRKMSGMRSSLHHIFFEHSWFLVGCQNCAVEPMSSATGESRSKAATTTSHMRGHSKSIAITPSVEIQRQ